MIRNVFFLKREKKRDKKSERGKTTMNETVLEIREKRAEKMQKEHIFDRALSAIVR